MVTKGYRKGVYERVTKGINGGYRRIGQTRPYIRGWGCLVQSWYVEGRARSVALPCGIAGNYGTKGDRL